MQGKNKHQPVFDMDNQNQTSPDPKAEIAIIGIACRFPGAKNHEEFWENLTQGRTSIRIIPEERWDWRAYWGDPQTGTNKTNSKWGGFIEDVKAFDPDFFEIPGREAELMDPQQRMALELSWSCFEDAGICPSQLSGKKVGVFIGATNFDYKELQDQEGFPIKANYASGNFASVITGRISYFFNFKGPSLFLDTACSSSLNAIHAAVQSIQQGECGMALAGGVNLLLTPRKYIAFAKMNLLSPTGSSKTFDEAADGVVRGEGAGLILLKPLQKAFADGDSIYGILKGSAINHNGKCYTVSYPNPEAQAEVIVEALKRAGITSESISYIEAHGTGTPKGDSLEFQGLVKAFQCSASQAGKELKSGYCGLGTGKQNIGHLESAAGIAGVIKVLLSMKHRRIPGLPYFKQLNPNFLIQNSPFYIAHRLQEWESLEDENHQVLPRRAGVSAFGFGGTNAHVVIEEAPAITKVPNRQLPAYLICLSAKTETALLQKKRDLALWLVKERPEKNLLDISATLLLGREHFTIRAAYVVSGFEELQRKLEEAPAQDETERWFRENNLEQRSHFQPVPEKYEPEAFQEGFKETAVSMEMRKQEYSNKLKTLAELYVRGYDPDWNAILAGIKTFRVNLPAYPFDGRPYWIPESHWIPKHDWAALETGNDSCNSSQGYYFSEKSPATPSSEPEALFTGKVKNEFPISATEMEEKVAEIWRTELGLQEIQRRDNLQNLGVNSINYVKIVNAIEKVFGFEFDDEKLFPKCFETLANVMDYVAEKIRK
jgi:acyl transferase domain-containing protein